MAAHRNVRFKFAFLDSAGISRARLSVVTDLYVDFPGTSTIQGGKSDAAGGVKIAKPFQWKIQLENDSALESSRRVLCFRKGSFPGYRGCSTDKKPKNVKT